MKKTVVLCFIHGFKGGESTFGENYQFTEDLRRLVARELPKVDVQVLVYPRFETRGDLGDCVSRFRSWLEEKVIDMEVAKATPSPTVEPSVRVLLVGHSMGGIVAAETVIGLTSDKPVYTQDGVGKPDSPSFNGLNGLMFPYVQGVLAFDTPFLGISPGVVAHGAEGHYQNAATAVSQFQGLKSMVWGSKDASGAATVSSSAPVGGSSTSWQKWGKAAMYAGAAGAVAAGSAAAWLNRDHLTEGWTWASSHLEFVSCLARAEELKKRIAYMVRLEDELDVGFANLYTRLGRTAPTKTVGGMVGTVLGHERTFCNLPSKQRAGLWKAAVNDKATDEAWAHMSMFEPKENPGYEKLSQDAKELIVGWVQGDWYEASVPEGHLVDS